MFFWFFSGLQLKGRTMPSIMYSGSIAGFHTRKAKSPTATAKHPNRSIEIRKRDFIG